VPHNTISLFVPEVCTAIWEEYKDEVLALPSRPAEWKQIARGFSERWNFHHCIGALDGKHVMIKKPAHSGTLNYNYKGFYSIVLMAIVDASYKFVWVSVGAPGSHSDGGIFKESTIYERILNGRLHIPPAEPLEGQEGGMRVPYFFVADDAFALAPWMMKPFPVRHMTRRQRIYNYRLSRARRIVENAFGILVTKWRCLTTTLLLLPRNCKKVTKACIALHNLIRMRRGLPHAGEVDQGDEENGAWRARGQLPDNDNMDGNRPGYRTRMYRQAQDIRTYLMDYYNSPEGAVPWQDRIFQIRRIEVPRREVADSPSDSDSEVD